MNPLRRIGIDNYMLLLLVTMCVALIIPAEGVFADVLTYIVYVAVALLFFLYGAKLDTQSVRQGIANWRVQILTFSATYVILPIIGVATAYAVSPWLGSITAFGFIFLAVLPSTVQSSIAFTSLSGGNVPAAICAASFSNLIGVALTPALLALIMSRSGIGIDINAVLKIVLQILLPFIVGQFMRPLIGSFVQRHRSATLVVDRGAILLIVYSAFSASTVSGLWENIPLCTLFIIITAVAGYLSLSLISMVALAQLFRLSEPDQLVLLFCGSTKSLATGLPIATALFPAENIGGTVLPLMVYHMGQLLVCAFISQHKQKKQKYSYTKAHKV